MLNYVKQALMGTPLFCHNCQLCVRVCETLQGHVVSGVTSERYVSVWKHDNSSF